MGYLLGTEINYQLFFNKCLNYLIYKCKPEYQSYLNLFLKNLIFLKMAGSFLKYKDEWKEPPQCIQGKTDEIKLTYINIHVYLNENISSNNVEKLYYYIIGICLAKVERWRQKAFFCGRLHSPKMTTTPFKDLTFFFNNVTGYLSVKRRYLGSPLLETGWSPDYGETHKSELPTGFWDIHFLAHLELSLWWTQSLQKGAKVKKEPVTAQ